MARNRTGPHRYLSDCLFNDLHVLLWLGNSSSAGSFRCYGQHQRRRLCFQLESNYSHQGKKVLTFTLFASAAAESGIPEIKGSLNGVGNGIHGVLLFRTLIGKIFVSLGSVGGGLALRKEGPLDKVLCKSY